MRASFEIKILHPSCARRQVNGVRRLIPAGAHGFARSYQDIATNRRDGHQVRNVTQKAEIEIVALHIAGFGGSTRTFAIVSWLVTRWCSRQRRPANESSKRSETAPLFNHLDEDVRIQVGRGRGAASDVPFVAQLADTLGGMSPAYFEAGSQFSQLFEAKNLTFLRLDLL